MLFFVVDLKGPPPPPNLWPKDWCQAFLAGVDAGVASSPAVAFRDSINWFRAS